MNTRIFQSDSKIKIRLYPKAMSNKNDHVSIMMTVNYGYIDENGKYKPLLYNSGVHCNRASWNQKDQLIMSEVYHKKKYLQDTQANSKTTALLILQAKARQILKTHYAKELIFPTPANLKRMLDDQIEWKKDQYEITAIPVEQEIKKNDFSKFVKNRIETEKGLGLSKFSFSQFKTFLKHLELFSKTQKNKVLFCEDIKAETIDNFVAFVQKKTIYATGTINNLKKNFKKYLLAAKESGILIGFEPSKNKALKRNNPKENSDFPFLTVQQLKKLESFKIDLDDDISNSVYQKTRDKFIALSFIGARSADHNNIVIDKDEDGSYFVKYTAQKTGKTVKMPAFKIVLNIYKKWGNQLPKVSPKDFNKAIKRICEKAGLNDAFIKNEYYSGSVKPIPVPYKTYELISTHTCRRNFCSNLIFHYNFEALTVMKYSLHDSLDEFLNYVKISESQNYYKFKNKMEEIDV